MTDKEKRNKILSLFNSKINIILIILILISSVFSYIIQKKVDDVTIQNPKYHFYFIGQNSTDPFWSTISKGVQDAAKQNDAVVEINTPRFTDLEEQLKFLDIAILSNVDGIITYATNSEKYREMINRAYDKGIPVVTVENDNKYSNRNAFVGSNSFQLGEEAGKLMIEATDGDANIAIIASNSLEIDSQNYNMKINGFLSSIKEYPNMEVAKVYTSKMGILSAEEITHSILNDNKEINAIFTTDYIDTLGVAQLVVDLNKVDDITLIGYGGTEEIIRYIDRGIIYGTVMSDPYKIGFESLRILKEIKENKISTTFVDTGFKIMTKENLYEIEKNKKYID